MTSIPSWAVRTKADQLAIEQGATWDQSRADAILAFAENLFRPQYVSGKFRLLDWQSRFLQSLYGWQLNGHRRFRTANLHVPKKQGKTLLVAIVSAFELLAAGEPSPFVVTGSVSKDNAGQVFAELRHTLTANRLDKFARITPNTKRIRIDGLNAEYRSLASDGDRVQGYNASCVILDELHAHKSSSLYDSLKYATAARPNGLLVCISTAGEDPSHFYHGIYSKSKRVLSGEDTDVTHYGEVYEGDPEADPEDPNEWWKANPSLGTSFPEDQFRRDMESAKSDPAEWSRFRRYRLNHWCRADETAYFDVTTWDKGKTSIPDHELQDLECWLGYDGSQSIDPSSLVACWHLGEGRHYVKSWAWVAREGVKLRERTTLPKYEQFAQEGCMEITEGDRIDDVQILNFICEFIRNNRVQAAVFDQAGAGILMGMVEAEGTAVRRLPPSHRYFNGPLRELHKAMATGRIQHDGNNWLRYCLSCVRVDENRFGEIRPHAKRSVDHIDGAVALCNAYSLAMLANVPPATPGIIWA